MVDEENSRGAGLAHGLPVGWNQGMTQGKRKCRSSRESTAPKPQAVYQVGSE